MTMCVNFVKIRLVVFDFYAKGQSQSVSHALREIIIWMTGMEMSLIRGMIIL